MGALERQVSEVCSTWFEDRLTAGVGDQQPVRASKRWIHETRKEAGLNQHRNEVVAWMGIGHMVPALLLPWGRRSGDRQPTEKEARENLCSANKLVVDQWKRPSSGLRASLEPVTLRIEGEEIGPPVPSHKHVKHAVIHLGEDQDHPLPLEEIHGQFTSSPGAEQRDSIGEILY
ncbi:hypothetical protein MKZ38_000916 [Zalerion maritima]|uniref:Uncharacterized protein n=1 Tax=Zalerion maritima TaxID=339359 RepID=A0AAD5WLL6_9PEZI|nr:hypothetical protein MKZ38_000916 [Zalerion maritima]